MEHINNIYVLLSIVVIAITFIIVTIIILRSGKSISVSKDGLSVYTKNGNFLNKEKVDDEKYNIRDIVRRIEYIKNIEIMNEQMVYIERELSLYYKDNLETVREGLGISMSDMFYKQYQLIYKLQKHDMLNLIRVILRENHLLDRPDWTSYKERQAEFTYSKAVDLLDEYFQIIEVDRRKGSPDGMREMIKNQYKMKFFQWMDEFKNITAEKTKQIHELNLQLENNLKGFQYDDVSK